MNTAVPACWARFPSRREDGFSDRKSTRLNSSHMSTSYAVFCLKKKKILVSVARLLLRAPLLLTACILLRSLFFLLETHFKECALEPSSIYQSPPWLCPSRPHQL